MFSEPAEAAKSVVSGTLSISLWDKWEFTGDAQTTLQSFLDWCQVCRDVCTYVLPCDVLSASATWC